MEFFYIYETRTIKKVVSKDKLNEIVAKIKIMIVLVEISSFAIQKEAGGYLLRVFKASESRITIDNEF